MQQIFKRFSNSSTTRISSSKSSSILATPNCHSHGNGIHFPQDLSHLWASLSMTIGLESYIICWLQPVLFYCLAYIFLTEEETVNVPFMHNMPFSVVFYYYIKRKRTVCIEILNLGLKRDLRNPSLYASKRALTSTSTFSFPYTLIPCFYMLDNGH
jgi:hypothetical protein